MWWSRASRGGRNGQRAWCCLGCRIYRAACCTLWRCAVRCLFAMRGSPHRLRPPPRLPCRAPAPLQCAPQRSAQWRWQPVCVAASARWRRLLSCWSGRRGWTRRGGPPPCGRCWARCSWARERPCEPPAPRANVLASAVNNEHWKSARGAWSHVCRRECGGFAAAQYSPQQGGQGRRGCKQGASRNLPEAEQVVQMRKQSGSGAHRRQEAGRPTAGSRAGMLPALASRHRHWGAQRLGSKHAAGRVKWRAQLPW